MRSTHKGDAHTVIIVVLVVALLAALGYIFWQNFMQKAPANFAECKAAAGSSIQESYPEVCVTKDGKQFTNPDQKVSASGDVDGTDTRGKITGQLQYPSEALPAELQVCTEEVSDPSNTNCTSIRVGEPGPDYGKYELSVPAGTYYVYAKTDTMPGSKAYYNEYVRCGLRADCPESSHSEKVEVVVRTGETTSDVRPNDWYM